MCVSAHSQHDRMMAIHMLYDHLTPHAQYIKSVPKATRYCYYTPVDNAKRHAYVLRTSACMRKYAQAKIRSSGCLSLLLVAPPQSLIRLFFLRSISGLRRNRQMVPTPYARRGRRKNPWRFQCAEIYPIVGGLKGAGPAATSPQQGCY